MDPYLQSAAVQLTELALRNTASSVSDRIRTSRAKKVDAQTIVELEQIINELIDDKNELIRIASVYKQALVSETISDDDITFITDTVVPFIEQVGGGSLDPNTMAQLKSLVSTDTVKILQLIGFNFRQAIGEPLTKLVQSAILSKAPATGADAYDREKLVIERELALARLASDADGFGRLMRLYGRESGG